MPRINWLNIPIYDQTIDGDGDDVIEDSTQEFYYDSQIRGKVSRQQIERYAEIARDLFRTIDWVMTCSLVEMRATTASGAQLAYVTRWQKGNNRLEMWQLENGYYVALQLENEICWIVGCVNGNSFVETNEWSSYDSNGSTNSEECTKLVDTVDFLEQTTLKYIIN